MALAPVMVDGKRGPSPPPWTLGASQSLIDTTLARTLHLTTLGRTLLRSGVTGRARATIIKMTS